MSRPFIPAPKTASVEWIYSLGGVVAENQVHVEAATNFTDTMLADLWTLCKDWWVASLKPVIATTCSFNRLRCKALHASIAPVLDQVVLPAQIGSDSQTPLGNNVSFVVKLTTGNAGRSARGRWYVAGLTALSSNNGTTVNSGRAGAYVNAIGDLKANLEAAGLTLVITSFRNEKAWRSEAVNYPVLGVVYTDLNLDSQRRRLVGRGR